MRIRAPANALSTASNWFVLLIPLTTVVDFPLVVFAFCRIFNFVVVMVTGPSFNQIDWGTYIVFAALNALIVPVVYFFFPG